jgi:hypothetical protein
VDFGGTGYGAHNLQHGLDVENERSSIDGIEISEAPPTLDVARGARQPPALVRLLGSVLRPSSPPAS